MAGKVKFQIIDGKKIKICSKCKIGKELIVDNFYFSKSKNRYFAVCIECEKTKRQIFYENNKENILKDQHEYYLTHAEQVKARAKKHKQEHREHYRELNKERYLKNKDKYKLTLEEKENKKLYMKEYRKNNKEKIREQKNKYHREMMETNSEYRLKNNFSKAITKALRENKGIKKESTFKTLSYSVKELKAYLENKFENWMRVA